MCQTNYLKTYNLTINLSYAEQLILNTQKKIYIAAKKCNLDKLLKLQNIIHIKKIYILVIIKKIIIFFQKKNQLKKNYANKLSLYIFLCLSSRYNYKFNIISFLSKKINSYYIYICLKPELEARYDKLLSFMQKDVSNNKLKHLEKLLSIDYQLYQKQYVKIKFHNTLINPQSIRQIFSSFSPITSKFYHWLNNANHINSKKIKYKQITILNISHENQLKRLLFNLLYLGLEWYIYINLRIKAIYKNITCVYENQELLLFISKLYNKKLIRHIAKFISSKGININMINLYIFNDKNNLIKLSDMHIYINFLNSLTIKLNNNVISDLFKIIRKILYHKNKKNCWRINSNLKTKTARSLINKVLVNWYNDYCGILNISDINNLNKKIDYIIYKWQIKH